MPFVFRFASIHRRCRTIRTDSSLFTVAKRALSLMMSLALSASIAHSSEFSAILKGIVADANGRALPGVRVSLLEDNSQSLVAEATTNSEGRFEFVGLPAGFFTLNFALAGWDDMRVTRVQARTHHATEITVSLSQINAQAKPATASTSDAAVTSDALFGKHSFQKLPNT